MYDVIALAKSVWYSCQAEKIHYVLFNPKESRQSVCVLSGGDPSHHALPAIMRMHLPNRELETTDAENSSIFGPHFHRVFNNHRPNDWPVLDKIKQRDVIEELYHPISWYEMEKATKS